MCPRNLQKSEYKKSKWVFKQGEVGDRFYIITSGTAEVIRSSDGYEELLSELGEGQFFGERSLLQQEPRFASIRATSQLLRTLSISKGAFEEVLGPLESLVKTVEYKKSEIPALVQQRKTLKRQGTMGNLGKGLTQIAAPVIRRHKPQRVGETQKAKPLFDSAGAGRGKHATFEDIVKADAARKELLSLARNNSPIQSVGRLSTLPRTVIPRILRRFPTWLVLIVYVISCIACRLGLDFGDLDLVLTAFESSNPLITFMIIFYVGYCYTRYEDQFKDVENMMHAIIDACVMARVAFRDPDEVLRLWRYLNLVHISAYTFQAIGFLENYQVRTPSREGPPRREGTRRRTSLQYPRRPHRTSTNTHTHTHTHTLPPTTQFAQTTLLLNRADKAYFEAYLFLTQQYDGLFYNKNGGCGVNNTAQP